MPNRAVSPAPILPISAFYIPAQTRTRYRTTGITRDTNGQPLAGVTVDVFEAFGNQQLRGSTVSDANGYYSLEVDDPASGLRFQCEAYLTGSPDRAGITVILDGTWG